MTATTNEARDEVILHVVNTSSEVRETQVSLSGFIPKGNMEIYTLSGELNDENLPDTPTNGFCRKLPGSRLPDLILPIHSLVIRIRLLYLKSELFL